MGAPRKSLIPIVFCVAALTGCDEPTFGTTTAAGGAGGQGGSAGTDAAAGTGGIAGNGGSSNDSGVHDATVSDARCATRRPPPPDVVTGRTVPDPDDPSCLLPLPEPLTCVAQCEAKPSPVFECDRPMTIVVVRGAYSLLRADARGVYWRSEEGNLEMARADLPRVAEIITYLGDGSFAIDDDFFYFGSSVDAGPMTLTRMKRDRSERIALATIGEWPWLEVDRESVYFNGANNRLFSVPKGGGAPVDVGLGMVSAYQLQIDDTHLYWLDWPGGDPVLKRKAKGSREIETIATGLRGVSTMQLQGDDILLLAAGVIWALPKSGGCARMVVAPPYDEDSEVISSFVADDQSIYWGTFFPNSDSHNFRVWHAPRRGGAAIQQKYAIANFDFGLALAPEQVFVIRDQGQVVMLDR